MAVGAIVVVSVSMLAAATLLPVLISLLGKRAWAPGGIVGSLMAAAPPPYAPARADVLGPLDRGVIQRRGWRSPPAAPS